MSDEQAELRSDLTAVLGYGEAHPGSWAGARFVNEPRVVIQVAFTGDLQQHRLAIADLVEHPDRVEVVQAARTSAELEDVRRRIEAILATESPNPMLSLGQGWQQLDLRLAATAEALAARLHQEFGDAISITVGSKPFPPRADARTPCPDVPRTTGAPPTIEVQLRLDEPVVGSGETARAVVEVTNTGDRSLTIDTDSPLVGSVLDHDRTSVVGVHVGMIAGTGRRLSLEPGATTTVPALIGTASCVPDAGYRLPAGRYFATVALPIRRQGDDGMPVVASLVPPPVPLELRA